MGSKTLVISTTKDGDVGLVGFTFMHDGKKYRVTPKGSDYSRLDAFFKFIKGPCERQGLNPFTYRAKDSLNIERVGDTKEPQEGDQLSLKFARKIERISSELSDKGLSKISEMLKPLAMHFRRGWLGPQSIVFFDDLSNAGVQAEDGVSVLDAYDAGVAEGEQLHQTTGVGLPVCNLVLSLARKHNLLDFGSKSEYL